jgi:hypothetical protein
LSLFEPSDRRRILAACITTLALVPLLLGSEDSRPGGDSGLAAIGQGDLAAALAEGDSGTTVQQEVAAPVVVAEESSGGPGYLIGPPPATEPTVVRIAVPPTSTGNAIQSTATFRRWEARTAAQPCAVQDIPMGVTVTVTSLQNGQSITCMVVGQPRPGDRAPVVLDADLFAQLADLIEQPIPVRVTW